MGLDEANGETRATVLVADDDKDILRLISQRLTHRGYRVRTARTGQAALEMALADPPDAAILDGVMPGLQGDQVCEAMRADPRTAGVPVLLLTAKAADADERQARDAGADAYIIKPFRIAQLDQKLKELLSAQGPRRET